MGLTHDRRPEGVGGGDEDAGGEELLTAQVIRLARERGALK
jgi:hypothetical protein